jgi:hypothetical protein
VERPRRDRHAAAGDRQEPPLDEALHGCLDGSAVEQRRQAVDRDGLLGDDGPQHHRRVLVEREAGFERLDGTGRDLAVCDALRPDCERYPRVTGRHPPEFLEGDRLDARRLVPDRPGGRPRRVGFGIGHRDRPPPGKPHPPAVEDDRLDTAGLPGIDELGEVGAVVGLDDGRDLVRVQRRDLDLGRERIAGVADRVEIRPRVAVPGGHDQRVRERDPVEESVERREPVDAALEQVVTVRDDQRARTRLIARPLVRAGAEGIGEFRAGPVGRRGVEVDAEGVAVQQGLGVGEQGVTAGVGVGDDRDVPADAVVEVAGDGGRDLLHLVAEPRGPQVLDGN